MFGILFKYLIGLTPAVAKRIATTLQTEPYWMSYATRCVQKGLDYFEEKFFHDFLPIMNAFESARLFNPGKVTDLKPTATTIDSLRAFPFLRDDLFYEMKLS